MTPSSELELPLPDRSVRSPKLRAVQRAYGIPTVVLPHVGLGVAIYQLCTGRISPGALELWLLAGMYLTTVPFGMTIGFHRHFTHRAFKLTRGPRLALGIFGSMAGQGPLIYWVSNHRRHHRYSDRAGDPHSPYVRDDGSPQGSLWRGFWHSHVGWLFSGEITNATQFSQELLRDKDVGFINRHYQRWLLLGLGVPAVIGATATGTWTGALQGLLWGGLARMALGQNAVWIAGSISHMFGPRRFETGEESRNNPLLAIALMGEWHHNHHAFPASATLNFQWWEFDPAGLVIRGFEKLGWATEVIYPPPAALRRKPRSS